MSQIHYLPDDQIIEIAGKDTVLYAGLYFGIPHIFVCGGNARCSTCRIRIIEGLDHCRPRNERERKIAEKLNFSDDVRLACQTRVDGDVKIRRLVLSDQEVDVIEHQMKVGSVGQEKAIAILFADIRGFTKLAESMLPYDTIFLLNSYFEVVGKAITDHGGMINNYMGDGIVALFGVKENQEAVAEQSIRAGLAMLDAVASLNQRLDILANHPLRIGIGIHYGSVVLGQVGAAQQKVMTAIGDAMNFASRIESATKTTHTQLLISSDTYELVQEMVTVGSTHQVTIAGKSGDYTLYEITNIQPEKSLSIRRSRFPSLFTKWLHDLGFWRDQPSFK